MKKYAISLFIFRRDLRIHDNIGLINACEQSDVVIPCFIFDPRQVSTENDYRSLNAIQFMIESLEDLHNQFKNLEGFLYFFTGKAETVVEKIIQELSINAVFCNRDYTPFSAERDTSIEELCVKNHIGFEQTEDLLLVDPDLLKTNEGKTYSVFTPFFKKASSLPVAYPKALKMSNFFTKKIAYALKADEYNEILKNKNPQPITPGGTTHALEILEQLSKQERYTQERDFPALDSTTHLSAHLKFGTISIRHTYHAIVKTLGNGHPLIRQLYWRDFFTHIAYHSPYVFGNAYKKQYNNLPWHNDPKNFIAWCEGKTGFPIVDAGMRQLNETGFMHNRVRMITASFLVKDLHIDWRWGEKYFAQKLIDYDPAVNNGNWQWCASTGSDAQPYFRVFNPWLQQKKFDAQCAYIKKWVQELKPLAPKIIHALFKESSPRIHGYPKPICDHAQAVKITKKLYKKY